MPESAETLRQLLAERTGTRAQDWHLVFKARYAMAVAFGALRDIHGPGSVATQIFTCATAVDPVLAGGLRPEYAEVSADSIAIDPGTLELADDTRAVVLQHTFGIIDRARFAELRERATAAGVPLIEDSAHCAGRMARDEHGEPLADVSIHSFGAEKLLPTRFGGAVWVNPDMPDGALRFRLQRQFASLPTVGPRIDAACRAYLNQNRVLNRLPGGASARARDLLSAARLFEPLISPAERRGELPYPPMAPSRWMVDQVVPALRRVDDIEKSRSAAVAVYLEALVGHVQIPGSIDPQSPLVRFPFFVPDGVDAEHVFAEVTRAGSYAGRWYRPAFFPGPQSPAAYNWVPGSVRTARTEELIARVVNLPTNVDPAAARAAAEAVISAVRSQRT